MSLSNNLTQGQQKKKIRELHYKLKRECIEARKKDVSQNYDTLIKQIKDKQKGIENIDLLSQLDNKILDLIKSKEIALKSVPKEMNAYFDIEMRKLFNSGKQDIVSMNPNHSGSNVNFFANFIKDIYGKTI